MANIVSIQNAGTLRVLVTLDDGRTVFITDTSFGQYDDIGGGADDATVSVEDILNNIGSVTGDAATQVISSSGMQFELIPDTRGNIAFRLENGDILITRSADLFDEGDRARPNGTVGGTSDAAHDNVIDIDNILAVLANAPGQIANTYILRSTDPNLTIEEYTGTTNGSHIVKLSDGTVQQFTIFAGQYQTAGIMDGNRVIDISALATAQGSGTPGDNIFELYDSTNNTFEVSSLSDNRILIERSTGEVLITGNPNFNTYDGFDGNSADERVDVQQLSNNVGNTSLSTQGIYRLTDSRGDFTITPLNQQSTNDRALLTTNDGRQFLISTDNAALDRFDEYDSSGGSTDPADGVIDLANVYDGNNNDNLFDVYEFVSGSGRSFSILSHDAQTAQLRFNDTGEIFTINTTDSPLRLFDDITNGGFGANLDRIIDVDQYPLWVDGTFVLSITDSSKPEAYQETASIICFTPDNLILTKNGFKPIGQLQLGDLVQTKDNGLQPVRWIYKRHLKPSEIIKNRDLAPVFIRKGSLGHGLPETDVAVSRGHMILVDDKQLLKPWDDNEALVPAKRLLSVSGISQRFPKQGVTYIHLLFDQHEIVNVEGSWMESFLPSKASLDMINSTDRREIFDIFPDLRTQAPETVIPPARNIFYRNNADRLAKRLMLARC